MGVCAPEGHGVSSSSNEVLAEYGAAAEVVLPLLLCSAPNTPMSADARASELEVMGLSSWEKDFRGEAIVTGARRLPVRCVGLVVRSDAWKPGQRRLAFYSPNMKKKDGQPGDTGGDSFAKHKHMNIGTILSRTWQTTSQPHIT